MLLYPVYALLFADAGLTTAQISSLFAIWSVVSFAAEVPAGALADAWSRRRLYALGELLTATGYAMWLLWPSYPGFALGFLLWGVGGSLASGSLEALVYDELEAEGRAGDYARVTGRAGTVAILAMLAATLLATPVFQVGGYLLVGVASIVVKTAGGLLALRLPENRAGEDGSEDEDAVGYVALLRAGIREAVGSRRVVRALLVAALVPGFTALDEYLPLLTRDKGAPTAAVPLWYALTALAMAAGSTLAGRAGSGHGRRLAAALVLAATLTVAGALTPHLAGMVAVSAAFGLLEFAIVRSETRLQEAITGRARSTVLSVAGFTGEVVAVCLYAAFAVDLPLNVLFALCAVPLVLTALLARR